MGAEGQGGGMSGGEEGCRTNRRRGSCVKARHEGRFVVWMRPGWFSPGTSAFPLCRKLLVEGAGRKGLFLVAAGRAAGSQEGAPGVAVFPEEL